MGLLLHDLTKHQAGGGHDQKSHGSWAQGRNVSDFVSESIRRAGVGRQLDVDAIKIGTFYSWPEDDLAKIIAAQGWNKPAPQLSDEEFQEAYDTGKFTIVYRTGPIGLEQGILKGTPYIGEGVYGVGTYVTDSPVGVLGYLKSGTGRSVVPMLVPTAMLESAARVEPESAGRLVRPLRYLREAAAAGSGALFTRDEWGPASATEYVIYNTSALMVGQPSEFPDTRIQAYVDRKPDEERLLWDRFAKMVDGWEDAPYYAMIDGKAVLVEFDDGVIKHQAGGGHDQKSHGSWAYGIAEKIYLSSKKFRDAGGTIDLADPENAEELQEEMDDVYHSIVQQYKDAGKKIPSEVKLGLDYARRAMGNIGRMNVRIARDRNGKIAGVISEEQANEDETEILYLGTTGIMSGVGSALVAEVMEYSVELDIGIRLISDVEAEGWWENQAGMEFDYDDDIGDDVGRMARDKVSEVYRALMEYRRKG